MYFLSVFLSIYLSRVALQARHLYVYRFMVVLAALMIEESRDVYGIKIVLP